MEFKNGDNVIGLIVGKHKVINTSIGNVVKSELWDLQCLGCGRVVQLPASVAIYNYMNNNFIKCECDKTPNITEYTLSNLDRERLSKIRSHLLKCCYDSNYKGFRTKGGRGIRFYDSWRSSLDAFIDWSVNNNYRPWHKLYRFNNFRDFSPENCYWAARAGAVKTSLRPKTAKLERDLEFDTQVAKRILIHKDGTVSVKFMGRVVKDIETINESLHDLRVLCKLSRESDNAPKFNTLNIESSIENIEANISLLRREFGLDG